MDEGGFHAKAIIPGMLRGMSVSRGAMMTMVLLLFGATREAAAVDCQKVRAEKSGHVVCRVDLRKERIELVYSTAGKRLESFEALRASVERQGRTLDFAMNAGMFHADFRPVGLLIAEGKSLAPINRASGYGNFYLQPNGIFLIDEDGARVLATQVYRNVEPRLATQSGPLLLDRGLIPNIVAFRPGSTSRFIRNGVCAPTPQQVAFVISDDPVTFFEFAQFFRDQLGCRDALYLDGSISSLYASQLERADHHARLGPMFAVTR
jgi:uncharacterized protein YigE (DUF2233 family)